MITTPSGTVFEHVSLVSTSHATGGNQLYGGYNRKVSAVGPSSLAEQARLQHTKLHNLCEPLLVKTNMELTNLYS